MDNKLTRKLFNGIKENGTDRQTDGRTDARPLGLHYAYR